MFKFITCGLIVIFNLGCSTYKKINTPRYIPVDFNQLKDNCLQSIHDIYYPDDTSGPVKIRIQIEHVQLGKKIIPINQLFVIKVDKESDLLVFGDSFALKFFHFESTEYGKIRHNCRYDFFIKETDCWNRKINIGFFPLFYSDNPITTTTGFSRSFNGDKDYIKVNCSITRPQ